MFFSNLKNFASNGIDQTGSFSGNWDVKLAETLQDFIKTFFVVASRTRCRDLSLKISSILPLKSFSRSTMILCNLVDILKEPSSSIFRNGVNVSM